jgi:hypothetical protein
MVLNVFMLWLPMKWRVSSWASSKSVRTKDGGQYELAIADAARRVALPDRFRTMDPLFGPCLHAEPLVAGSLCQDLNRHDVWQDFRPAIDPPEPLVDAGLGRFNL